MQGILLSLLSVVIIQTPMVRLVPLQKVHDVCGSQGAYDACTLFVAYRLDAACAGPKASATVTFRPFIYLHNLHQLSHEKHHIEDIRRFAAAYVTDIEQKQFESESQCRADMAAATEGFGATMQGFARESMMLQDFHVLQQSP